MAEETTEGIEARIKALTHARDAAKLEAAEARASKAALEAEIVPLREASRAWGFERAFLGHGLADPEGQDIARILHERIPEAERPELGAWLTAIKAEPAKMPKALAPYLAAPAAGAKPPPQAAPPGAKPPPARSETTPAAGVAVTKEALRAAYVEATRTGDFKTYDSLAGSVMGELERRG